jgi:hypothetical protein
MWSNTTLTGAAPEPWDIGQGELGDCYYLGTIAAIAEFPYRLSTVWAS